MGTVIYSATTFEAFLWDFVFAFLDTTLVAAVMLYGIFARKQKMHRRVLFALGGGLILVLLPRAFADTRAAMRAEARTMTALVERKSTVDWDDYCTPFALEAKAAQGEMIFFVARPLGQAEPGSCYSFTYHAEQESPYVQALGPLNDQYAGKILACYVTRIEVMDESACR